MRVFSGVRLPAAAITAMFATGNVAFAFSSTGGDRPNSGYSDPSSGGVTHNVPEIDAGAGLLAVAAIAAAVVLAWELRRRKRAVK